MANDGSYQLKLDTSLTKFRLGFPCKYIAVDGNSTGQALAYVDSKWSNPIQLYPGYSGLVNAQDSLYVDVGPQPGKFLQLFYGDDPIITSPALRAATDAPIALNTYSNKFTGISVAAVETIVSAQQNVSGIKILGGIFFIRSAGNINEAEFNLLGDIPVAFTYDHIIAVQNYANNSGVAAGNQLFTYNIPIIYFPPNIPLAWHHSINGSGAAFSQTSLLLNYQLL